MTEHEIKKLLAYAVARLGGRLELSREELEELNYTTLEIDEHEERIVATISPKFPLVD